MHKEVQQGKRKRDAKEARKKRQKGESFFERDEERGEDKRLKEQRKNNNES